MIVKAQISIEFMVGISILLLIYIVAISFFSFYTQDVLVEKELGQQVCYRISTAVDSAVVGGSNFVINTTLPDKIYDNDYFFQIDLKEIDGVNRTIVTVDWNKSMTSCSIPGHPINEVGERFESPCKLSVENSGGILFLECVN